MKNLKNLESLSIYFIGIGGISMSGLAKMCLSKHAQVCGSDEGSSPEIEELKSLGVKIYSKHQSQNINKNIDLVVYTVAIKTDNPELLEAQKLGLTIMERAEFLGVIANSYQSVISIAGTHGKTTTTTMITEIFVNAGLNPTAHIGGRSVNLQSNTIIGGNQFFIVEACEYKNSFRFIKSNTALITNIELDHLDYYKDYNHLIDCFNSFGNNSKKLFVVNDISIEHNNKTIISNKLKYSNLIFNNCGYDFDVYYQENFYSHIRLNMLGRHNVENAINAIAIAIEYNINPLVVAETMALFKGVERRYEIISQISSVPVVIDYAHHPSEIKTSIDGFKQVYNNPLIIFQPHTYSRTLKLFEEFENVLNIDNLFLYQTYPAREEEIIGGRAEDLAVRLDKVCLKDIDEVILNINNYIKFNNVDAVLVLGAGDLAMKLKNKLNENCIILNK